VGVGETKKGQGRRERSGDLSLLHSFFYFAFDNYIDEGRRQQFIILMKYKKTRKGNRGITVGIFLGGFVGVEC